MNDPKRQTILVELIQNIGLKYLLNISGRISFENPLKIGTNCTMLISCYPGPMLPIPRTCLAVMMLYFIS